MARQLRLEYPGSLWHLTVRGNERHDIVRDDQDRHLFVELLAEAVQRFGWILTSWVLMTNHFHLVVEVTRPTLSRGMHWLNGVYAQAFNRRHHRVGHLLQGRFHGVLIDKDSYFMTVLRYVVLNPVRANMVTRPEDYAWSSYRGTAGLAETPEWLAADEALSVFGEERAVAQARYRAFVDDAIGSGESPWKDLVGQIFLGSEQWAEGVQEKIKERPRDSGHPRAQRELANPPMAEVVRVVAQALGIAEDRVRNGGSGTPRMLAAWLGSRESFLPLSAIAAGLRMASAGHVSRLIRRFDDELSASPLLQVSVDRCCGVLHGVENRDERKV